MKRHPSVSIVIPGVQIEAVSAFSVQGRSVFRWRTRSVSGSRGTVAVPVEAKGSPMFFGHASLQYQQRTGAETPSSTHRRVGEYRSLLSCKVRGLSVPLKGL